MTSEDFILSLVEATRIGSEGSVFITTHHDDYFRPDTESIKHYVDFYKSQKVGSRDKINTFRFKSNRGEPGCKIVYLDIAEVAQVTFNSPKDEA